MELWSAAVIGIIGSVIYSTTKKIVERYEVDDPLDNCEIHGFCGLWSLIALGLFDNERGLINTGDTELISIQFLGALAYSFWSVLISFIFFYSLKLNGRLRCKNIYEIVGQDLSGNMLMSRNSSALTRYLK